MEEKFERYHPDMEAMHRGFRTQPCFVCKLVGGDDGLPRYISYEDERAVAFLDGYPRVLLVRGEHRGWEPPGGQVELGEDLFAALKREVREESGCEVEVGGILSVNSNLGRPEKGVPEMVVLAFTCEWVGGEPRAGNECIDAGWFALEEAIELVRAPQQRAKLLDATRPGQSPRYRAYRTRPYEALLHEEL